MVNFREWTDATADDASVSAALGVKSEATWISHQQKKTYDDFRSLRDFSRCSAISSMRTRAPDRQCGRELMQQLDDSGLLRRAIEGGRTKSTDPVYVMMTDIITSEEG